MLGDVLKCIRIAQLKSVEEVANQIPCSVKRLNNIESGKSKLTLETLEKLAECYDMSARKIIDWEDLQRKNNWSVLELLAEITTSFSEHDLEAN